MKKKNRAQSYLTAGMAAASLLAGCGRSKPKWANTPGAKGHTNLDAVKKAFQKHQKISDFENRVNEICEGDKLVLFRSDKVDGGFKLSAMEDLDDNKRLSDGDDLLFTLQVANGTATLKGAGVTSYYSSSWPYKPDERTRSSSYRPGHYTHFHHWYGRSYLWGGGYYTRAPRYDEMLSHRNSFRKSSAFSSQVQQNVKFENSMSKKYGSGFTSAKTRTSANRDGYVKKAASSHKNASRNAQSAFAVRSKMAAKSSFSGTRSSSSRSSSSRGFGGFRGSSGFEV